MSRSLAHLIASRAPSTHEKSSGLWTQPRSTFTVPSRCRSRARARRRGSAEDLFKQLADRMAEEDVAFLDSRRGARRNTETHVAEVAHLPALLTRQADDDHSLLPCHIDRPQDIPAVSARRDGEEDIALAAVGADLAREDLVVTVVVADRRQG